MLKNVAIILAGGRGKRFGGDIPKQFTQIAGRTILEWTVSAFSQHPFIDEICIVVHQDFINTVRDIFFQRKEFFYSKVKHVICGGEERYHSSLVAIDLYASFPCRLLIHDAVRPLISQQTISRCIDNDYRVCAVGVPCVDTIWQVGMRDDIATIASIPDRSFLWQAQTPQCFAIDILREAYAKALNDVNFIATDDCGVVCKYMPDIPIHIIEGDVTNIKITYPSDIELVSRILASRNVYPNA